jgi:capsular exopolysaccharide synthesis family protein
VATKQQLDKIDKRVSDLQDQLAGASGADVDVLRARLNTELTRYGLVYQRWQELIQPIDANSELQLLGAPTTTSVTEAGLGAPNSRGGRMLLLGILGLLLGGIAALVIDRLDTRLRFRDAVEAAFSAPVVAEVPRPPMYLRRTNQIAVVADPAGPVAEAYRTLRSAVLLAPLDAPLNRPNTGLQLPNSLQLPDGPQVILVASARARDGKTTTVANLAAALAEAERSVLVIDCDLRKPEVGRQLDVMPGLGLAEIVSGDGTNSLSRVIRPSSVPNVSVVTAGQAAPENPALVLLRIGAVIQEARRHADIVLIDSAPMLVANDTNDLLRYVDSVVLCCRVGHVSSEQAGRVRQLINRGNKPVVGVTLVGVPSAPHLLSTKSSSTLTTPRLRDRIPFHLANGGQHTNDQHANDQHANGQHANGQHANGQQANGQQANGQYTNGQYTNGQAPSDQPETTRGEGTHQ